MRPAHIQCGRCDFLALFGEGWERHAREAHGLLIVRSALTGRIRYVPIASHPEQKDQA